jgi:hypothetical protein
MRAYIETIRMTDKIFAHKFYQRALRGAVGVYLSILDMPVAEQSSADDSDLSHLSPAERKKEKERRRKLKKKELDAETLKAQAAVDEKKPQAKGNGEFEQIKDDDPKGEKLLALPPLEEASKWCLRLQLLAGCDVESRAVIADVMTRRNRFISALRNISIGLRDFPRNPELTLALVKLVLKFDSNKSPNPMINSIVQGEINALLGGVDLSSFVMQFFDESVELGLRHRNAAVKCLLELGSGGICSTGDMKARAATLLVDDEVWNKRGIDIKSALEAFRVILQPLQITYIGRRVFIQLFIPSC